MKILIVDDEKLARDRLRRLLDGVDNIEIVGEAADGVEAVKSVEKTAADIVLLDVRMPGMDGLEAAGHMAKLDNPPAVIFCTAYEEHAIAAFDVQAVGYLLKPVRKTSLQESIEKASKVNRAQLSAIEDVERKHSSKADAGRTHISARTRLGIELVAVDDVRYFMAEHKYVTVKYGEGAKKEVLIDQTLKELEDEFQDRFVRIHRNSLIAVDYLEAMERDGLGGQYQVRLKGIEDSLTVSRRHVADLRRFMQNL